MKAAETAAPNPAVGIEKTKMMEFHRKRRLTGTSSPMTNAYEYPVEAESPISTWPPMSTSMVFAVDATMAPMQPKAVQQMKNQRRLQNASVDQIEFHRDHLPENIAESSDKCESNSQSHGVD